MPSIQPFTETTTLLWVRHLELLGGNPKTNPTQNWDPPPKPKPASIPNPAIEPLLACTLTSALEGDQETGVASALATSLDRTLTLAEALSPWGPNSKV